MILDVGCGHTRGHIPRGNMQVDLAKPCVHLENFVQADAEHLPFQPSCFDAVFIIEVLYYIPSPKHAIQEANRVLCEHGKLVLGLQNPLHYRRLFRLVRNKPIVLNNQADPDMHIQCWTQPEITNLLSACNFGSVRIVYHVPESPTNPDVRTHIRLDKLAHAIFRNALTGRSFLVFAIKR